MVATLSATCFARVRHFVLQPGMLLRQQVWLCACMQEFAQSQGREMAGFDNVAYSMLSVFQSMTLSNWSFTMYRTMDYLNPAVVIYWLVMIIFGAFFVVSMLNQSWWGYTQGTACNTLATRCLKTT